MTIGEKIKQARHDAGITQRQLANAIGMYLQTVSKIENDAFVPNHKKLVEIAEATGKPPEFFGWQHADPATINPEELTPGQIVTIYRTNENLSQRALAYLVSTRSSVIREWENDENMPKNEVIETTAAYFEIEPSLIGLPPFPDIDDPLYKTRTDLLIHRARMALGLTQADVARAIGVPRQTAHSWEEKPVKITKPLATKLAETLNLPLESLYTDNVPKGIKNVTKYLKYYRNEQHLSQNQLSKLSGVSVSQISLIETGRIFPSPDITAKLQAALDMDFDALPDNANTSGISRKPANIRTQFLDGDALRNARVAAALTQEELARKIGRQSSRIIEDYETETTVPERRTLARLAKALNVQIEALTKNGNTSNTATNITEILSENEQILLRLYRALPDQEQRGLLYHLRAELQLQTRLERQVTY